MGDPVAGRHQLGLATRRRLEADVVGERADAVGDAHLVDLFQHDFARRRSRRRRALRHESRAAGKPDCSKRGDKEGASLHHVRRTPSTRIGFVSLGHEVENKRAGLGSNPRRQVWTGYREEKDRSGRLLRSGRPDPNVSF